MNNRIRELMLEAGYAAPELAGRAHRLTESLIKEAIEVMEARFMGDLNREDLEVRRCVQDIRKHFGVEE